MEEIKKKPIADLLTQTRARLDDQLRARAEYPVDQSAASVPQGGSAGLDLSQLGAADQKIHVDARRFARLLVSEIKLYNGAQVLDGRKNKDLYKRLRSEIDRGRQSYEKRFGKAVAKQFDYFHEEVVRTLASNDPSLLGLGYPGPSV